MNSHILSLCWQRLDHFQQTDQTVKSHLVHLEAIVPLGPMASESGITKKQSESNIQASMHMHNMVAHCSCLKGKKSVMSI